MKQTMSYDKHCELMDMALSLAEVNNKRLRECEESRRKCIKMLDKAITRINMLEKKLDKIKKTKGRS